MQLILNQSDLDQAICTYVATLGMDLLNKNVVVNFTAGRGVNGNTATVEITKDIQANTTTEPATEVNTETKDADGDTEIADEDDSKSLFEK